MESLKSDKEKDEVELAEETNKLAKVKSMNVRASWVVSKTRILILMSPKGEASFLGCKYQDVSALREMSSTPILAENMKSQSNDFNSTFETYRLLQDKREIEAVKLNNIVINDEVSRDSVYEDLRKIYKKRNVTSHKLHITSKGEDAVGDGVARDECSVFFSGVYTRMDGCYEKIRLQILTRLIWKL